MRSEPSWRLTDLVGLEAGPMSEWLHAGLSRHGLETVLMETRHVRAALKASLIKTDRRDAHGIAQLLRIGWFRPVHVKTASARERRVLLGARDSLVRRLRDLDNSVRGLLRGSAELPAAADSGRHTPPKPPDNALKSRLDSSPFTTDRELGAGHQLLIEVPEVRAAFLECFDAFVSSPGPGTANCDQIIGGIEPE